MSDKVQKLFRPCSANRLLLPPHMQAKGIASFIYVDTDTLWLEDPASVFAEFAKFGEDHELGFTEGVEGPAVGNTIGTRRGRRGGDGG